MISDMGDSFEDYRNEIFPADGYLPTFERASEIVFGPLDGRIEKLSSEGFQDKYRVDQCVDALVPSDGFRAEKVGRWEAVVQKWKTVQGATSSHGKSLEKSNKLKAWCFVVLTIGGLVGAIMAAIAGAPFVCIPFGVVMVGGVIASSIYFKRATHAKAKTDNEIVSQQTNIHQAQRQIEKWSASPVHAIAKTRLDAYKQGFTGVYHSRSYRDVLLPFEVEGLFWERLYRHTEQLQSEVCVSNRQKADWLVRFWDEHPISRDVLVYVYGQVPLLFFDRSSDFEQLKSTGVAIQGEYDNRQANLDRSFNQAIHQIESDRRTILTPIEAVRDFQKKEARANKEKELKNAETWRKENPSQARSIYDNWIEEVETIYKSRKIEIDLQFSVSSTPMNLLFDQKIRDQKLTYTVASDALANEERNELSRYFEDARYLNENIALCDVRKISDLGRFPVSMFA